MTIDWDAILKVWAVLGPLLAASASAMWTRKNQMQDRAYESTREGEKSARTLSEQRFQRNQALEADNYKELKSALANFMVCVNDFTSRQCEWLTTPNAETKAASLKAIEEFNYHLQLVILLGQSTTADLASEVWNMAFSAARSYSTPWDSEHQTRLDSFKNAKVGFAIKAREELASRKEV